MLVSVMVWMTVPARAEDVDTWVGGHVTTGLQAVQGVGVGTILSQVELDVRAETGPLFFRLDLDYHFDPLFFVKGGTTDYPLAPHYPVPPEVALVQIGQKYHLRAGVTNANFGIQEWDEKANYLPSYSNVWDLTNGQNLGLEPGITFDDGTELFAFGGYDLAWLTPGFGAGVATEQDAFGTWTGFFYLPDLQFGMVQTANEIYPADWLWLTLELDGGPAGKGFYVGSQLIASILPDATVGGAVRYDQQHMSDAAVEQLEVEMDNRAIAGALRADPTDTLHLALEAKESWPRGGGDPYFTGTFLIAVLAGPEPGGDYVVSDPEEEPEPPEDFVDEPL